jgi:hypothetical protein
MFNNFFLKKRAVYDIMWKNMVKPGRPQMTIRRMRFACWITKATDAHSEYVILLLHGNNGYMNATQCFVIRTLRLLFNLILLHHLLRCCYACKLSTSLFQLRYLTTPEHLALHNQNFDVWHVWKRVKMNYGPVYTTLFWPPDWQTTEELSKTSSQTGSECKSFDVIGFSLQTQQRFEINLKCAKRRKIKLHLDKTSTVCYFRHGRYFC